MRVCDLFKFFNNFRSLNVEETYGDKSLESELISLSDKFFKQKTFSSLQFSNLIGNMYTPSLYGCLVSYLLNSSEDALYDTRINLFSYGSGFASSMFSIVVNEKKYKNGLTDGASGDHHRFTLKKILINLSKQKINLENRVEIEPALYDKYLKHREIFNKKGLKILMSVKIIYLISLLMRIVFSTT